MQAILEQNIIAERVLDRTTSPLGKKIGLWGKLFGCWHNDLGRPFTNIEGSYRVCTDCGARAKFDIQTFKTLGEFYFLDR